MEECKKNVLKNKNFFLLFQGTVVSNVAAILYSYAISFYILELTNNNTIIQGTYLAIGGIMFVLMSFIGGVLADRWNKAKIIYMSDFLKGIILLLSTAFIYIAIKNNNVLIQIIFLFIIGIFNNIIAAVFSPASMAIIPEIVQEDQLQQANSYFSILNSFQAIIAIVLAGILYSLFSIVTFFLIVGICYVISGFTEIFIKVKVSENKFKLKLKDIFIDLKEAGKYLYNQKAILIITFGILFINFFFSPISSNCIPYLIKVYISDTDYMFKNILPAEMWSSVFTIFMSIGSLTGGIMLGQIKQKKNGISIKIGLLSCAILLVLMTVSFYGFVEYGSNINTFLIIVNIILVFLGVSVVVINISAITAIQKKVDKEKIAKVMSLVNIGSQGLVPISTFIAGLIINYFGLGLLFSACSLGLLVVSTIIANKKDLNTL